MPAVSKNQQIAASIAKHHPEKLYKRNRGLLSVGGTTIGHMARTKRKGLPKRKVKHA